MQVSNCRYGKRRCYWGKNKKKDLLNIVFLQKQIQEGNADPTFKLDFYIFLLIFQHKWMFLSTMQTLPFEGHNVACQCKGLDQSNIVCEYEVNLSITEKQIVKEQCWISRSYEGQGHNATCMQ